MQLTVRILLQTEYKLVLHKLLEMKTDKVQLALERSGLAPYTIVVVPLSFSMQHSLIHTDIHINLTLVSSEIRTWFLFHLSLL